MAIFWQAGHRLKGGVLCPRSEPLRRYPACLINPDQGEALSRCSIFGGEMRGAAIAECAMRPGVVVMATPSNLNRVQRFLQHAFWATGLLVSALRISSLLSACTCSRSRTLPSRQVVAVSPTTNWRPIGATEPSRTAPFPVRSQIPRAISAVRCHPQRSRRQ